MNEHELSDRLDAAVAHVTARPDLAEVEAGGRRVRNRRRVVSGVLAAMLVAGAGGAGFGIGRSVADDDPQLASAEPVPPSMPEASAAPTTSVAAADEAPPVDTSAVGEAGVSPREEAAPAPVAADSYTTGGWAPYTAAPLELVLEQTIDDGYRVRVMRGEEWGDEGWEGEWRPADFCWGNREMRITIDGPDVVDVVGGSWYDELYRDVQVTSVNEVGWADGRPMRILTVQAAAGVSEVAVTWADGATARAPVSAGVAVLVVDGGGAFEGTYTLEVTGPNGTSTLTQADLNYASDPDWRASCEMPPPALPEAGEQPADPDAARAEIEARFDLLWDRSVPFGEKPAGLLDDETGIAEAAEAVMTGDFAETAESAEHVLEELVFTSPTEAWFRYGIETSTTYFGQRYGTATLTDAGWTFPRALVCQDLSLAGGVCNPGFEPIYPPSWYEMYGPQCIDGEQLCVAASEGSAPPLGD